MRCSLPRRFARNVYDSLTLLSFASGDAFLHASLEGALYFLIRGIVGRLDAGKYWSLYSQSFVLSFEKSQMKTSTPLAIVTALFLIGHQVTTCRGEDWPRFRG